MRWYPLKATQSVDDLNFTGEHDGLTLSNQNKHSRKQSPYIYKALSNQSDELNKKVLHTAVVLVPKTMTAVGYEEFVMASKDPNGVPLISTAAIKKIRNWREANNSMVPCGNCQPPCCNDGQQMIPQQIEELRAT